MSNISDNHLHFRFVLFNKSGHTLLTLHFPICCQFCLHKWQNGLVGQCTVRIWTLDHQSVGLRPCHYTTMNTITRSAREGLLFLTLWTLYPDTVWRTCGPCKIWLIYFFYLCWLLPVNFAWCKFPYLILFYSSDLRGMHLQLLKNLIVWNEILSWTGAVLFPSNTTTALVLHVTLTNKY